jgi:TPR repeat protein
MFVGPPSSEELAKGYTAYEQSDYKTALNLLLPFAEAGKAEAQCTIGAMFQLGLGIEYDYEKAIKWYSLSAKQGCPISWNNLATIYSVLGDKKRAKECYHEAVRLGFNVFPPDYYDD